MGQATHSQTFYIRSSASRFGQRSQQLEALAMKVGNTREELFEGEAWRGTAATAFAVRAAQFGDDLRLSAVAMRKADAALQALAFELDHVNELLRQVQAIDHDISDLQNRLYWAEEEQKQQYHNELNWKYSRRHSLQAEADNAHAQANAKATAAFQEVEEMVERLHFWYEAGNDWDFYALIDGSSKWMGHAASAVAVSEAIHWRMQGMKIKFTGMKTPSATLRVQNGHVAGMNGSIYRMSNASQYSQVVKYVNPVVAGKLALKDFKGPGGILGALSVAVEAISHLKENIQDKKSGSYIASELLVDVALGAGGVWVSATAGASTGLLTAVWVGALSGSAAGPVGFVAGAVVGVLVGLGYTMLTDGFSIDGKPVNEHLKDGVQNVIEGVGAGAEAAVDFFCDLFDESEVGDGK